MSTTRMPWETWIRFGVQSGQGTAAGTWYTYDADGPDSLTMGEVPVDRASIHGNRTRPVQTYRKGHYMPGGALGAYPFHMGTESPELMALLHGHFGTYAVASGGGTAESTFTFAPIKAQVATASWPYLTFQKDTGIAGAGEQYLDTAIDQLAGAWAVDNEYYAITPTVKALSGGTEGTITGNGTAISDGFFQTADISFTWNGTVIYPTSFDWTGMNAMPDGMAASNRGRTRMNIGDYTGNASLSGPREDDWDAWFIDHYGAGTAGTMVMSGTLATSYGTLLGGGAIRFDHTFYLAVNPVNQPTGQGGELVDSVAFTLLDHSLVMYSDATSI